MANRRLYVVASPQDSIMSEKELSGPMNAILKNEQITIEIEPEHGCIQHFMHEGLAIDLVQETRLAENFRLLLL